MVLLGRCNKESSGYRTRCCFWMTDNGEHLFTFQFRIRTIENCYFKRHPPPVPWQRGSRDTDWTGVVLGCV